MIFFDEVSFLREDMVEGRGCGRVKDEGQRCSNLLTWRENMRINLEEIMFLLT